jgi:hypothetical protein
MGPNWSKFFKVPYLGGAFCGRFSQKYNPLERHKMLKGKIVKRGRREEGHGEEKGEERREEDGKGKEKRRHRNRG